MRRARATIRFSLNLYLAISILPVVVIIPDVGKFRVQKVNSVTWALGQHSGRNVERGIPPSWMILIVVRSHVQLVADPIRPSPWEAWGLEIQHHVHHKHIRRDRVATVLTLPLISFIWQWLSLKHEELDLSDPRNFSLRQHLLCDHTFLGMCQAIACIFAEAVSSLV